jgi:hypothetical protein
MSEIGDKVISELKSKAVLIIVGAVLVVANQLWSYIQKGAEADIDNKIEEVVVASLQKEDIIKELMKNPRFVQLILESEEVRKFEEEAGMRIRDEIVERVIKSDTNKVSMRSFLGKEVGIRDEQVLPLLAALLKAYEEGDLATKEELTRTVNREIRRANANTAEF